MSIIKEEKKSRVLNCAGFIILNKNATKTIIVSIGNNHGFPKGKRHKGEHPLETALRELKEETDIDESDINILESKHSIIETSRNDNPSIKYYIGITDKKTNNNFIFDHNELDNVAWYDIHKAKKMLREKRINALNKAIYISKQIDK